MLTEFLSGLIPSAFPGSREDSPQNTLPQADLELPSAAFFHDARFLQDGSDLLLLLPDGDSHRVTDYFNNPDPVLHGLFDGTRYHLSSDTVGLFLEKPAMVAETIATSPQIVGSVEMADGLVLAISPDGSQRPLETGDPLYQGEVLETGEESAVRVVMLDETLFTLGASSRMAVNDLDFDATSGEGTSSYSILKGSFLFVSGLIAKHDPADMEIITPVATIGVRGTIVSGEVRASDGEVFRFSVIDGAISVETADGTVYELEDSFEQVRLTTGETEAEQILSSLAEIVREDVAVFRSLSDDQIDLVERSVEERLRTKYDLDSEVEIKNIDGTPSVKVADASERAKAPLPDAAAASPEEAPPAAPVAEAEPAADSPDESVPAADLSVPEAPEEDSPEEIITRVVAEEEKAPKPDTPGVSLGNDDHSDHLYHGEDNKQALLKVTGLDEDTTLQYSTDDGLTWSTLDRATPVVTLTTGLNRLLVRQLDADGVTASDPGSLDIWHTIIESIQLDIFGRYVMTFVDSVMETPTLGGLEGTTINANQQYAFTRDPSWGNEDVLTAKYKTPDTGHEYTTDFTLYTNPGAYTPTTSEVLIDQRSGGGVFKFMGSGHLIRVIRLDQDSTVITGSGSDIVLSTAESGKEGFSFHLGAGDDVFYSSSTSEIDVFGGDGDDRIEAGLSGDWLDGGTGKDRLYGSFGDDRLVYDSDDLVIDGGPGVDSLIFKTGIYDFSETASVANINSIEKLDLREGSITLTLDGALIGEISRVENSDGFYTLAIEGDSNDKLTLANVNYVSTDSFGYQIYTHVDGDTKSHISVKEDIEITLA